MAAELIAWGLRSALAVSVALALVLALRPLWRRTWGSGAVLWLWLLVPAALAFGADRALVEQPVDQGAHGRFGPALRAGDAGDQVFGGGFAGGPQGAHDHALGFTDRDGGHRRLLPGDGQNLRL